jgi:DNA-binding XRE family transcriptional regulator
LRHDIQLTTDTGSRLSHQAPARDRRARINLRGRPLMREIRGPSMPTVRKARKPAAMEGVGKEEVWTFGRNFREARIRASITQKDVHELTGIAISFLSGIENGERNLSVEVAAKLAKVVGRNLHELLNPHFH